MYVLYVRQFDIINRFKYISAKKTVSIDEFRAVVVDNPVIEGLSWPVMEMSFL